MSESPQRTPLVVAAVLTWNDTEMTSACLRSVFASDYSNVKVVLVDNGSSEPCGRRLRERFPAIDLVELKENRSRSRHWSGPLRWAPTTCT